MIRILKMYFEKERAIAWTRWLIDLICLSAFGVYEVLRIDYFNSFPLFITAVLAVLTFMVNHSVPHRHDMWRWND